MVHGPISSNRTGVAVAGARAEPGREHLAIYARQLVSNRVHETYVAIIEAVCEA
jgi:hypothetical protein